MDNHENNHNTQSQQYHSQPTQYPPPQQQYPPSPYPAEEQGKGKAIASLVLGIIAIVLPIPVIGTAAGVVGLVLASLSKKEGFVGGIRTAGFVCSLIGVIGGAIWTIIFILGIALFATIFETIFWHQSHPMWW